MEANITERRYSDDELPLAEPHFEEEATLLSAQPVVPLNEIRDATPGAGSKKHLAVGLSILASLIIGAFGATLVLRQRGQRSATEIVDTAIAGADATAGDSDESSLSTGEVNSDLSSATVPEAKGESETAEVVVEKSPRLLRRTPIAKTEPEAAEILSPMDEREMRRAERIEARRLRRMAAREERDASVRGRRRTDDLLRIREIFEGSRRP